VPDPTIATRPLPHGVTAEPLWWPEVRRADGEPADRLTLRWTWAPAARPGSLIMVGLNPSGASAEFADATLIRVYGYARREGFGSLLMLNLFSARATEPAELTRYAGRPGYALEVAHQIAAEPEPSILVAGWGSQSGAVGRLVRARVAELLPLVSRPWHALGTCADGAPRHPLYTALDAPLALWTLPR